MMIGLFLLVVLLWPVSTSTPIVFSENSTPSTTFPVCDVERADQLISDAPYAEVVGYLFNKNNEIRFREDEDARSVQPILEAFAKNPYTLINAHGQHPLVLAIQMAYADHRPLELSPDMIWLVILQGFAKHVDLHGEELREHFVEHDGRKVLYVQRDDYVRGDSDFPWPEVFETMADQISQHTDSSLVQMALEGFSTTGPTERAAFQVALMDAMSSYFLYAMGISCGIPEITLQGTPEDWAALEERTAALGQYELSWWTDELQPVLQEFTAAAEGNPNTAFWQDIFQLRSGGAMCGAQPFITGWILKFFPYHQEEQNPWITQPEAVAAYTVELNAAMEMENDPSTQRKLNRRSSSDRNWSKKRELYAAMNPHPGNHSLPAIELSDLPVGLSCADLLVDYLGVQLAYELHSGFIGIRQDPNTMTLSPEISWYVVDTGMSPLEEDSALYEEWKTKQSMTVGRE